MKRMPLRRKALPVLSLVALFLFTLSLASGCQSKKANQPDIEVSVADIYESDPDDPKFKKPPRVDLVQVRKSDIPGAGKGLFAKKAIKQGTYLGPYSGEFLTQAEADERYEDKKNNGDYFFFIPDCANEKKYTIIDGIKGNHVSKVNFAPSKLNGQPTNLQNVNLEVFCTKPYVRLIALRDIKAGEELYADYGTGYTYEFMDFKNVKNFFLKKMNMPLDGPYKWEN